MSVYHLSIFSNSTNELLPIVSGVLRGKFVPNQTQISSKSFVLDFAFNVLTKSDHHLVCNYAMSLEPVPVNAPVHMCQCVNIVKSVLCHLRVSSLAKLMFINLNTVRSLIVCNAVKSARHRVFPVTRDVISNHRQAFSPKTNVLCSSRTKSYPSYSTSNLGFPTLIVSSWKPQHISLSAKPFNMTLLNQPTQNILSVNILTNLNESYFAFISLFTTLV